MEKMYQIDLDIYSSKLLGLAIKDFKEVANISLNWAELLIGGDDEASIDEVFNEFMNYLLSL